MPKAMPPTLPRLPDVDDVDVSNPAELKSFLTTFAGSLTRHLVLRPTSNTAQHAILMQDEDGLTYRLKIVNGVAVVEPFGSAEGAPI